MLTPKKTKFRKPHRGRMKGKSLKGNTLFFGDFGLQAKTPGWVTSRQIEAGRRTITRTIKRGGKVYIRIFPHKPVTAIAAETRMGSGKGSLDYWVAVIKPQRILYEIKGVPGILASRALQLAGYKMPVQTKIISLETSQND